MLPASRSQSLKCASPSPLTTGEIYSHLQWKVWFWGQTKMCKAGWECPGLGGFYMWHGSSYDCAAFWGTIIPLMQWNLSSLGLLVTALVTLRPGRGWLTHRQPFVPAEGSAWSFLWGDIQMNPASSILHSYISRNRFDLCFARYKWAKLYRGDSRKHHKHGSQMELKT